jgi:hypothetical protein
MRRSGHVSLGAALAAALALSVGADAADWKKLPDPSKHKGHAGKDRPLVLKEQGSFFVGGETKTRGPDDDVTIHQMYVEYMVPLRRHEDVPVVMTHGCCLSSATWETTPDGRMGWDEYFVRNGHPVYLTDQTGRARSGFDATPFNQVRAGELPPESQPQISHVSHQSAWDIFRFGPAFNEPFPDQQSRWRRSTPSGSR